VGKCENSLSKSAKSPAAIVRAAEVQDRDDRRLSPTRRTPAAVTVKIVKRSDHDLRRDFWVRL
jgi:hypothetical protein